MRISDWSSDVCSSDLGFQQDMAAPAQIQTKVDLCARDERRPFRNRRFREEIGDRKEDADQDGDRKSTRLKSSQSCANRIPTAAQKHKQNEQNHSLLHDAEDNTVRRT